jgi:hypothetical protein
VSPALAAHMRLMHSIPKERIRTHEQNNRYLPKRYNAPTPQWKIDEMVRLKKEGKSWAEIASELMVSEATVHVHLKKRGLVKPQKQARGQHPGAGGRKVKWGSKTYDSIKECAKAVGLSTHAIRRRLGLKKDGRKRHDLGAVRQTGHSGLHRRERGPEAGVGCFIEADLRAGD